MKGVPIDESHLDRVGPLAKLVELPRRADGAPQPGEATAHHDDSLHAHTDLATRPGEQFD